MYPLEWTETVSACSQFAGLFIKMGTSWIKICSVDVTTQALRTLPNLTVPSVLPHLGSSPSPLCMAQDPLSAHWGCLSMPQQLTIRVSLHPAPAMPSRGLCQARMNFGLTSQPGLVPFHPQGGARCPGLQLPPVPPDYPAPGWGSGME